MLVHDGFRMDPETQQRLLRQQLPSDFGEAKSLLEEGHERFRNWVARSRREEAPSTQSSDAVGLAKALFPADRVTDQTPFAITLGCADARVPLRMLLGSTVNDLFEIRVAGQVLGDECLGSIEYALGHLATIRLAAVIGHMDCGAIKAAVEYFLGEAYLRTDEMSTGLKSIIDHLLGIVVAASHGMKRAGLEEKLGEKAYQERLVLTAGVLNAAAIAHRLRWMFSAMGRDDVGVVYGVYDIRSASILHPSAGGGRSDWSVGLAHAPESSEAVLDVMTRSLQLDSPR